METILENEKGRGDTDNTNPVRRPFSSQTYHFRDIVFHSGCRSAQSLSPTSLEKTCTRPEYSALSVIDSHHHDTNMALVGNCVHGVRPSPNDNQLYQAASRTSPFGI